MYIYLCIYIYIYVADTILYTKKTILGANIGKFRIVVTQNRCVSYIHEMRKYMGKGKKRRKKRGGEGKREGRGGGGQRRGKRKEKKRRRERMLALEKKKESARRLRLQRTLLQKSPTFAKEPYKRDLYFAKRPILLSVLLIVATL